MIIIISIALAKTAVGDEDLGSVSSKWPMQYSNVAGGVFRI